jgi:diaminohydroxyphosphoribosylaminopyrimidine deaminase/5-amino-6-(5-phosphoribosylamino)uracil reductase
MDPVESLKADVRFIQLAIALGYRAIGHTWPNPPVGCVLVKDGIIVGTGHTGLNGRPHAETNALREAGKKADGATAYVTLEPCSHIGITGPCALKLIEANVRRVVCPLEDPDPRVSGTGFRLLEKHGVIVDRTTLMVKEARTLAQGFLKVVEQKRPFIALKLALSLNGKIATKSYESNWISGKDSRALVHFFRSRHDGVMVGRKTASIDNPNLNLRGQFSLLPSPKRIILDQSLSLKKSSNFANQGAYNDLIIVHDQQYNGVASRKWHRYGAKTIGVKTTNKQRLDLEEVMIKLASFGLTSILVEGGGELATSLLDDGLVDLIILFTAGVLIEKEGIDGFNPMIPPNLTLSQAPRFSLEKTFQVGNDVAHFWRPLN